MKIYRSQSTNHTQFLFAMIFRLSPSSSCNNVALSDFFFFGRGLQLLRISIMAQMRQWITPARISAQIVSKRLFYYHLLPGIQICNYAKHKSIQKYSQRSIYRLFFVCVNILSWIYPPCLLTLMDCILGQPMRI